LTQTQGIGGATQVPVLGDHCKILDIPEIHRLLSSTRLMLSELSNNCVDDARLSLSRRIVGNRLEKGVAA
jgi:hypothetical protein